MPDPTAPRPETMNPEDVPAELIDLAMTGAKPGCRGDAAFYLANVLPEIKQQVHAQVAAETRRETAERILLASDVALGYRCPACYGKPAVHRWKNTGRKRRY
ncbi:MAG TPA: hypothetical protein VF174_02125, partial [Micromonosporaceae bacterium]